MTAPIDLRHVSILWATPEHAAELATLHAGLFDMPWDAASLTTLLSHPGSTAFVARAGQPQQIVGFILGQLAADEAEILTIGVRKDCQRRGIGRRLIEALARATHRAEAKRLLLEVGERNAAALALYRRAGFVEIGRRRGYYEHTKGPAEDALALVLVLGREGSKP
jgi:ribosomal-protein-alanine N-acetyltransferase